MAEDGEIHQLMVDDKLCALREMLCFDEEVDVDQRGGGGLTPLHFACRSGRLACASELLRCGASVNARDATGATPLHAAVSNRHADLVALLLANGADRGATNEDGDTPLAVAGEWDYKDIAELLVEGERADSPTPSPPGSLLGSPPGSPRVARLIPRVTPPRGAALAPGSPFEPLAASLGALRNAAGAGAGAARAAHPAAAAALAVFEDAAGRSPGPVSAALGLAERLPGDAAVREATDARRAWAAAQDAVRRAPHEDAALVAEREAAAARMAAAADALPAAAAGAVDTVREAVSATSDALEAAEEAEAGEPGSGTAARADGPDGMSPHALGAAGCDAVDEWASAGASRVACAAAARSVAARATAMSLRSLADAFAAPDSAAAEDAPAFASAALDELNRALERERAERASLADRASAAFPASRVASLLRALLGQLLEVLDRARRASEALADVARARDALARGLATDLCQRVRAEHEAFAARERPLAKRLRKTRYDLVELKEDGAPDDKVVAAAAQERALDAELCQLQAAHNARVLETALLARDCAPELLKPSAPGGEPAPAWREALRRASDSSGLLLGDDLTLASFEHLQSLAGARGVLAGELEGAWYALKEYPLRDATAVFRECARLHALRHPHVAELCGLVRDGDRLHVQMPYYAGGTAADLVKGGGVAADPSWLRLLARQLLLGLDHVHRAGVVHGNVQPSNLLLDADRTWLRIGDFDVSVDGASEAPAAFCAPELLQDGDAASPRATPGSDVYSAGLTLFDLRFPPGNQGAALRPEPRAPWRCSARALEEQGADAELARLLSAMLERDPARRPSAAAALAHPYFTRGDAEAAEAARAAAEAEEARLGGVRACAVCLDEDVREAHGVACPRGDPAHFLCDACFSRKVLSDSDLASVQNRAAERDGLVYCVGYTQAGSACHREAAPAPYEQATVAARTGPDAFEAYQQARDELTRARVEREVEARREAERRRQEALDERARRVEAASRHVRDNILTLRCPNPNGCGQAFVDFDDCFAVTCGRCQSAFCAWCLEWCGKDAHPHVRQCPHRLGADPYYGTLEQFERSNLERRRAQLDEHLASLDAGVRDDVVAAVRRDLEAVGIVLD